MTAGPNTRLAVFGAGLVALACGALALHVPGAVSVGSPALVRRFVALLAVSGVLYLVAARVVLREGGGRGTCALVLVVALAERLPALAGPPFLSSDLYRYIWDGRVQLAGINPYRYIPAAPALAPFRDTVIFDHINRRFYAPTIYPPAAQMLFRAIAAVSQTPLAVKLAAVGCEGVAVLCLIAVLRRCGQPPARVLLYAWNPLAVWSYAGNGHVDAEAIALLSLALLARAAGRDGWTGAALGAAILVKFLPVAVAPALWRWRWRMPAVALLTIVSLYLPFIGVGLRHVFGFLGSYGHEEGFRDGRGIWLLAGLGDLIRLPSWTVPAYALLVALALGAVSLSFVLPRPSGPLPVATDVRRFAGRAGFLAAASTLAIGPHYSWYFPFLAIFAVLRPSRALLWMAVSPLVLYLSPWKEFFLWPAIVYGPALLLFVLDEGIGVRRPISVPAVERTAS